MMKRFGWVLGFAVLLAAGYGSIANASGFAKWTGYDYPAVGAVLSMAEGDVDGDGKNEIVAISFEADEETSAPAMAPRLAAPGSFTVTVNPNIFDPAGDTKITFGNLPTQSIIVIYNEFENKMKEIWIWGTTTCQWNVRNNNGDMCPSGNYKYLVINRQAPDQKAEGFFTIKNVRDRQGGLIVRILKFNENGSQQLLDELKVRVDGMPIVNLVVKDVDKDGRDEITFSAMYETKIPVISNTWVNWDKKWTGRVYVYGYNGSELVQKYQSPNLLGKKEIMLGLGVADSDGDGKNEIIIGKTAINQKNSDTTDDNFDLLRDYIDQRRYLAAANLLHSGLIRGPLLDSSITSIEYNSEGFHSPCSNPSGPGLLYNLTCGNLDADAQDEIVANTTDLNYKNVNKFIEDLAWEIARADKKVKPALSPKPAEGALSLESDSSSIVRAMPQVVSQILETEEFGAIFPDAQIAKGAVSLFGQALMRKEEKPAQAPPKPAAAPSDYWYTGHPWYDNNVNEELISRTEETLIPEGTKFPSIPESLLKGQLKLLNWNGSGYELKESSQRVGFFSQNMAITKNKEIVVKAVEANPIHAENLLNSIMSNLVRVEEVTRSRWVEPYSGNKMDKS